VTQSALATTAQSAPLLEVEDLCTYFYRRGRFGTIRARDYVAAVDGVSFDVRAGETLGIVGESGCGKTTLGRTLLRLVPATSGCVRYAGRDLLALPAREMRALRREIQMVFQDLDAALNPKMRVRDLLAEALTLHRPVPAERVEAACDELLARVKLDSAKRNARPTDLSGGEKRRVSIARVLAVEPRLIVADEPLSALDVSIAAQVANLMRDLQQSLGLTLLFISHDLRMVELLAHRVVVMYLGKIVEIAPVERIAERPAHPYSRLLWDASDPLGARRADGASATAEPELAASGRIQSGCRFRARCPIFKARGEPVECSEAAHEPVLREIATGHRVACHFNDL